MTDARLLVIFPIRRFVLQCVASAGIVSSVFVTTSAIFSSPILRGAPQRGSSSRPSKRFLANRFRHSPAVSRERPSVAAIAQLFMPSAANSTISARTASTRASSHHRRIADGTAPADLTVTGLAKALPYSWAEQERSILQNT